MKSIIGGGKLSIKNVGNNRLSVSGLSSTGTNNVTLGSTTVNTVVQGDTITLSGDTIFLGDTINNTTIQLGDTFNTITNVDSTITVTSPNVIQITNGVQMDPLYVDNIYEKTENNDILIHNNVSLDSAKLLRVDIMDNATYEYNPVVARGGLESYADTDFKTRNIRTNTGGTQITVYNKLLTTDIETGTTYGIITNNISEKTTNNGIVSASNISIANGKSLFINDVQKSPGATVISVNDDVTINPVNILKASQIQSADSNPITVASDLIISGNATINGTLTSINSTNLNVADNHVFLNKNYDTVAGKSGSIIVNSTAVGSSTICSSNFVAGVSGISDAYVDIFDLGMFVEGDIVQIYGSETNDGLYEVHVQTSYALYFKSQLNLPTKDFVQNQINSAVSTGSIVKVNISQLEFTSDQSGLNYNTGSNALTSKSIIKTGDNAILTSVEGIVKTSDVRELSLNAGIYFTGSPKCTNVITENLIGADPSTEVEQPLKLPTNILVDQIGEYTGSVSTTFNNGLKTDDINEKTGSHGIDMNNTVNLLSVANDDADTKVLSINSGTGAVTYTLKSTLLSGVSGGPTIVVKNTPGADSFTATEKCQVFITLVGAGGGGGGGKLLYSSQFGGGGGGAGSIIFRYPMILESGQVLTLNIGAAGTGGGTATDGTNGGTTTCIWHGKTLTAYGGGYGSRGYNTNTVSPIPAGWGGFGGGGSGCGASANGYSYGNLSTAIETNGWIHGPAGSAGGTATQTHNTNGAPGATGNFYGFGYGISGSGGGCGTISDYGAAWYGGLGGYYPVGSITKDPVTWNQLYGQGGYGFTANNYGRGGDGGDGVSGSADGQNGVVIIEWEGVSF